MSDTKKSFDYGHFVTLVAKDSVVKQFGETTQDWPPENFWAMVSTYRCVITREQIPQLMQAYGVHQLINCPEEFRHA